MELFQAVYRQDQGTKGQTPGPTNLMFKMPDGRITEDVRDSPKNDTSKAVGPDGIHLAIAKQLPEALVKPRTQLFSASQEEGRLLVNWLASTVTPAHKCSDRDNCGGYRPVRVISIVLEIPRKGLSRQDTQSLGGQQVKEDEETWFVAQTFLTVQLDWLSGQLNG